MQVYGRIKNYVILVALGEKIRLRGMGTGYTQMNHLSLAFADHQL
jgi:hypothetical protein